MAKIKLSNRLKSVKGGCDIEIKEINFKTFISEAFYNMETVFTLENIIADIAYDVEGVEIDYDLTPEILNRY